MTDLMLSARELADLRADVLVTLVDTCTILRASLAAVDAYGDVVPSAGTAGTGIACRLDPFSRRSDSSGLIAGREANTTYLILTLPWDATIDNGDQVLMNGETMDVMQLFDNHSDRAVRRAVLAKASGS